MIKAAGASIMIPAAGSAAPQCGALSRTTAASHVADRPGRTGVRRSQSVGLRADLQASPVGTMIKASSDP